MDLEALTHLCHAALMTVLLAIAPIAIASTLIGLLVALVEAITSIQDQALVTTVRLFSVVLLLFFKGGDIGQMVLVFASEQFRALANIGVAPP